MISTSFSKKLNLYAASQMSIKKPAIKPVVNFYNLLKVGELMRNNSTIDEKIIKIVITTGIGTVHVFKSD